MRNLRSIWVEQELPTLPQHLNSPPVFSGICDAQSLVFCVFFFIYQCLSFFFWPLYILSFFDLQFLITSFFLKTHNLNDHTKQHYKWRTSNNCKSNQNSTQASLYLFLNLLNDNSVSLCIDCLLASFSLDIFSSFHWKKLHSLRSLKAEQA